MPSRAEVAATAREMHHLGLAPGTTGNVSARDGDDVWITAAGAPYEAMTEADVVPIGDERRSSEWRLHAAMYAARPDIGAIVHTHSPHATRWSEGGAPLDADGPVPTAPFAPNGTDEIAAGAVAALGAGHGVLLARHGVVGVGGTLDRALAVCAEIERAAEAAAP